MRSPSRLTATALFISLVVLASAASAATTAPYLIARQDAMRPVAAGDVVYYVVSYGQLWRTDGTPGGTVMLADVQREIDHITPVGRKLFFIVDDRELWVTDGSIGGTRVVRVFHGGNSGWEFVKFPTAVGETLYFAGDDGPTGMELWKSDGTEGGTVLVKDINPQPTDPVTYGSQMGWSFPTELVAYNGEIYFSADDGTHGYELWRSDGTAAGTTMVRDLNWSGSYPRDGAVLNGLLYFIADDGTHGDELWKTDGTAAGTSLVCDCVPGSSYARPTDPTAINGKLYFQRTVSGYGDELWVSDGTAAGTFLVKDIRPGTGSGLSYPVFYEWNGKAVFVANDGVHGYELWSSDGTTAGTTMIADLSTDPYSAPNRIVRTANGIFFHLKEPVHGEGLWRTDGTEAGTTYVGPVGDTQWVTVNEMATARGLLVLANSYSLLYGANSCDAPDAPGVTALASGAGVSLSWAAMPAAVRYNVYRSMGDCPGGIFDRIGDTTDVAFTDTGVVDLAPAAYKVTAVNAAGCESLPSPCAIDVCTIPPPAISFAGVPSACGTGQGGTATVAAVSDTGMTYHWAYRTASGGPLTELPYQTSRSYTLGAMDFPGIGDYLLVCRTVSTCGVENVSNEIAVSISSTGVPPTIVRMEPTVCPGASNSVSVEGQYASYQWSITGGTLDDAGTGQYAMFHAGTEGPVVLTVEVTELGGCTASNSITVPLRTIDPPALSAMAQTVCPGTGSSARVDSNQYTSYSWSITGGTLDPGDDGTHQYVMFTAGNDGPVTLTVTVTDPGGCSASNSITLPLRTIDPPALSTMEQAVCPGAVSSARVDSNEYTSYSWSITGGTLDPGDNGTHQYVMFIAGNDGPVTLTATVTDQGGCRSTSSIIVPLRTQPPVITLTQPSVCPGGTGTAAAAAVYTSYQWSITNGTIDGSATGQSVTFIAGASGPVVLTLTVPDGQCSPSSTANVEVGPPTPPTITASGPTALAPGESVTLTSSPAATYHWSNDATTQAIVVTMAGSYTVTTADAAGGCSATSEPVTVTVTGHAGITPSGDLVTARYAFTMTELLDGRQLVVGGFAQGGGLAAGIEAYSPSTGTFTQVATLAEPRYGHIATRLADGRVLICGGNIMGSGEASYIKTCEMFDPLTNSVSPAPSMTKTRSEAKALLLNDGRVIACGGFRMYDGIVNTAEVYDPATNSWSELAAHMTSPRALHTATLLDDGTVLIAGGYPVAWTSPLNSAEIFDPVTNTFAATGWLPATRARHNAVKLSSGKVAIVGNEVGFRVWDDISRTGVFVYDPAARTFAHNGYLVFPREGAVATAIGGDRVVVSGGSGYPGEQSSLEIYDAATGQSAIAATLSTPRAIHKSAAIPGGVLLVGGHVYGGPIIQSSEVYSTCASTPPSPEMTLDTSMLCMNVERTAAAPAGYASYRWDVAGATLTSPADGQTVTFKAVQAEDYGVIVNLSVTDANGCASGRRAQLQPVQAETPYIYFWAAPGCAGTTNRAFTSTYYTNYHWTVTNATLVSPDGVNYIDFVATTPGVNVGVTMTANDYYGCPISASTNIGTDSLAAPVITFDAPSVCANALAGATASGDTYATWKWTITGGTIVGADDAATVQFQAGASGTVTLAVTVKNAGASCTKDSSASIPVDTPRTAPAIQSGAPAVCAYGAPGSASATAGEPGQFSSYAWTAANGVIDEGQGTNHITWHASGTADVVLNLTVGNGACATAAADAVTVPVNPLPVATVTASGSTTFCEGGSVTLTADAAESYLWSNGATTQSIIVTTAGAYSVEVTNATHCAARSAETTVTVHPLPAPTITASGSTTFCEGGSVTLTASPAESYLWSNSATTQSITVTASGAYSVEVTDANTCVGRSADAVVTVHPLPAPTITASGPTTFPQGGSVTLTASAAESYLWSNGADTQSITVTTSGAYSVEVTNAFNCAARSAETVVTVNAIPASPLHTTIAAAPSAVAADGASTVSVTVQLKDVDGVSLTAGEPTVVLAATAGTLSGVTNNHDGTLSATLLAPASAAIATISGTLDGEPITSTASVVFYGPASHFAVVAPASTTAAAEFEVTVTVLDDMGNTVEGFTGTLTLASDDPAATLPAAYELLAGDRGAHTFAGVALRSVGNRSITATSGGVSGGASVTVRAGTTTSVTSSPNPSSGGAAVTLTASIGTAGVGAPVSGSVTFRDGATTLGTVAVNSFVASLVTSSLAAGAHAITAAYDGDANFFASTSAAYVHHVSLAAPLPFQATYDGTSIQVSWGAVVGAAQYELSKSVASGTFTVLLVTDALSFVDTAVTANTAYVYRVRGVDAAAAAGPALLDQAVTVRFSDDPLVSRSTRIKALHVTELRAAIAAMRAFAGLPAPSYSKTVAAGATISAADITEMRSALDQARGGANLPPIAYVNPSLAAGGLVKTAHIEDLRNGVK